MSVALLFKLVLLLLLFFIIFNLARALFMMVRGKTQRPMSDYLGRRVLFSAIVVVVLLLALSSGVLIPNVRPY